MSGVLYIVATPIGNLDDITHRAVEVLKAADLIAAEDTRHSQRLLAHLGIRRKMLSLHEHNEARRVDRLLSRLQAGDRVALISDAGTPLISDPGYALVHAVREAGIRVSPVPGPSAIVAALSAAGLPTDRFSFHGFLSQKNAERLDRLAEMRQAPGTQVVLESSHRIRRLLEQLQTVLPERRVVVAKELTKTHENFLEGTAAGILRLFDEDPSLQKGEFVVLIDGPGLADRPALDDDVVHALTLLMTELSVKKAVKLCSELTGCKRNELYQAALAIERAGAANP